MAKKKSRYNALKLKGDCEKCGAQGIDIDHLMPQELANENGFIGHIHKNHPANLANICKECHAEKTRNRTCLRRVKTSNGMKLVEC